MSHTHSFGRDADRMYWDDDSDAMIVERDCEHRVRESSPGVTLSGGVSMTQERACEATQVLEYELQSVVDNHGEHEDEGARGYVVRSESRATTDGIEHVDDVESVPVWVEDISERVRKIVDSRDVGLMMAVMSGPEIATLIATSETEYNITFSKVRERIEE